MQSISCLIDPRVEPPLMLGELARRTQIVEGVGQIRATSQPISHFLQSGLFDQGKPVQELFPEELGSHRPYLGAIVYDLIPWLFPDAYLSDATIDRQYRRVIPAISRLDRLFAISESVRRDVIAIAGVEPRRVVTIHGGLDDGRWAAPPEDRAPITPADPLKIRNGEGETFTLPAPFWLYVGGDDFRKNLPRLIEAFALLKGQGPLDAPLVVACAMGLERRRELLALARELGLDPGLDVVLTGFVTDEVLRDLFAACLASIFPSLYEGLGLPVVESYASGKAVLASDTSSFRELVPERCRFDPYDAASIADAIRRFYDDPSIAEESLAFAPLAIAMSRWDGAARKIGDWLDGGPSAPQGPEAVAPLWVVSSLPPDRSGVAFYTQRSFCAPAGPLRHIFCPGARTSRSRISPQFDSSSAARAPARVSAGRSPVVVRPGSRTGSEARTAGPVRSWQFGTPSGDFGPPSA